MCTHIAIPHIANKSTTKHSANNHYIRYQQQPYMLQTPTVYATNTHRVRYEHPPCTLRTPTVYADLSCPHIHSQPRNNNKHTRTQRISNHETTTNIYGRDKSAPTPNGMYTNHSWNVRNTFHNYLQHISQNIRCNIINRYPPYTLRTPTVYADLSCPHIHSQPRNNNKHTRTQRISNHETTTNIYGRDKSAPTPNGMYTNHSWNVRNTFRKIFDAI